MYCFLHGIGPSNGSVGQRVKKHFKLLIAVNVRFCLAATKAQRAEEVHEKHDFHAV
jgi:hypothetical protein